MTLIVFDMGLNALGSNAMRGLFGLNGVNMILACCGWFFGCLLRDTVNCMMGEIEMLALSRWGIGSMVGVVLNRSVVRKILGLMTRSDLGLLL